MRDAAKRPRRPRLIVYEQSLQRTWHEFMQWAAPDDALFFSVPNEGKRGKAHAGVLKAMGLTAGVADYIVFWRGTLSVIEFKVGDNKPTRPQEAFEEWCARVGARYRVCRSCDQALAFLVEIGMEFKGQLI